MRFSFSFALSLMMWLAVLIYWLESFMARMEGMQPMVLPLAALCAVLPVIFPQVHLVANASATGFKLHFLAAMLAYSLLTLSALHAIFMGFTENALHKRLMKRSLASLPPLLAMESLLFRMLLLGFVLLTLTVGSGVLFSEALFGKPLSFDHSANLTFARLKPLRDPVELVRVGSVALAPIDRGLQLSAAPPEAAGGRDRHRAVGQPDRGAPLLRPGRRAGGSERLLRRGACGGATR